LKSSNRKYCDKRQLVLRSNFSDLEVAVDEAEAFYARYIEDPEFVYKIVLLTSEAVTNAIKHGNGLDADKSVTVDFSIGSDVCEVWVEDEGSGFDPGSVADPLTDDQIFKDGGRGIFLIEELADEIRYENQGRKIGMIFHRALS
jgi:serine/threonine-protein kinase RsbW